jgi:hypothetical protein
MANFIMGTAPVSVSAVGTSIVDPEIGAAGDVDTNPDDSPIDAPRHSESGLSATGQLQHFPL